MIRKFIKFCLTHNVPYIDPSVDTLCAYIEMLVQSFRSCKSVNNYISGVRLLHKYVNVHPTAIDSFEVSLMLRAASLTMRDIPNQRGPIDITMLHQLCAICSTHGKVGLVIRMAILLAFFAFLRASNLCTRTTTSFDISRDLTRADVLVAPPGLNVRIKWTKTLQRPMQPLYIPVPRIKKP